MFILLPSPTSPGDARVYVQPGYESVKAGWGIFSVKKSIKKTLRKQSIHKYFY